MPSNYEAQRLRTIELYNRSVDLQKSIRRLPRYSGDRRDRALARYYNNLRQDVLILLGRSQQTQLIPGSIWCLESWHVIVGFILLWIAVGIVWLVDPTNLLKWLVAFLGAAIFIGFIATSSYGWWWKPSKVSKVAEHARRLHGFLHDYLEDHYPELTYIGSNGEAAVPDMQQTQITHLEQALAELRNRYDALSRRIQDLDRDIGISTDSFRKGSLVEQRDQLIDERDVVANEMAQTERKLRNQRAG